MGTLFILVVWYSSGGMDYTKHKTETDCLLEMEHQRPFDKAKCIETIPAEIDMNILAEILEDG